MVDVAEKNQAESFPGNKGFSTNRKELQISVCGGQMQIDWWISIQKQKVISYYFHRSFSSFRKQLRVYRLTNNDVKVFSGFLERKYEIAGEKGRLLLTDFPSDGLFCLEIGILVKEGKFFPLLRSERFRLADSENEVNVYFHDENWTKNKPRWHKAVSTYTFYNKEQNGWKKWM